MLVVVGLAFLASLPAGAVAGASIPVGTATAALGGIAAFYIILTVVLAICVVCLMCGKGRTKVVPEKFTRSFSRRKYKFSPGQAFELKGRTQRGIIPEGGDSVMLGRFNQTFSRPDGSSASYSHGGTGDLQLEIRPPSPLSTQRLRFHNIPPREPSPLATHRHTKEETDADSEEVDPAIGRLDLPYSTQKSSGSSNGSSGQCDNVFEDQAEEQPSPLPTREEIKKRALKLRSHKGRTPSTKPLLNGSESSDGPPTPMEEISISYGHTTFTQPTEQVNTNPTPSYEHRHEPATHLTDDPTIDASRLNTSHEDSVSQPHKGYDPDIARERPKPSPKKVSSSVIIDVPIPGTVNQSPIHIPYTERETDRDHLHGAKSVQREETLL